MSAEIRVGIAGLGRSGWGIHSRVFEKCPTLYKVAGVFDPIDVRRREAAERFGCKTYSDFDQLIGADDIELLVISTPSHLHAAQAIAALKAGKMVVCEKPMATSLAEADAIIDASKRMRNLLTVFQNRRFAPDFMKVREVIQSGKLGRIVLIKMCSHSFTRRWDWQTLQRFGGGELRNNGPHFIDQALQLFGEKEPEIICDLQRTLTLGDAEDHVKIILRGKDSPMIDIEISHACAYPQNGWLVMGTYGGLNGSFSSIRWRYFNPEDLPPKKVDTEPTPDRSYNREDLPWKEEMWDIGQNIKSGEITFYEELYKTIRHGAALSVTPESVRRVMWVIEKCRRSCEMQAQ